MTTYTKRTNAKRAAIKAGIAGDRVEITVHKKGGEVRFGFKKKEAAPAAEPVVTTPAPEAAPLVLSGVTREVRNGVKRPLPGGKCDAVWQALDAMRAGNVEITAQAVADLAVAKSWNLANAQIEFYGWRKFHGLSKPRVAKPKKEKEPKLPRGSEEECTAPYTA